MSSAWVHLPGLPGVSQETALHAIFKIKAPSGQTLPGRLLAVWIGVGRTRRSRAPGPASMLVLFIDPLRAHARPAGASAAASGYCFTSIPGGLSRSFGPNSFLSAAIRPSVLPEHSRGSWGPDVGSRVGSGLCVWTFCKHSKLFERFSGISCPS